MACHSLSGDKNSGVRVFPGGSVVKNPPANAGDMGVFNPGSRKITHDEKQVSPGAIAAEPML